MTLALTVTGTVALRGGEAAAAQPLSCGDTITTDTTLHHDLVNCPNNGIRIGADGVTLDLNGHTIDGDGKPFAACGKRETCDSGVVAEGPDDVTVTHGTVREFSFTGLNLGGAGPPAHADKGRHTRVLDVSAVNDGVFPIGLYECVRCVVKNSAGIGSTDHDSSGLGLFYSQKVRILHNSFRRSAHNGMVTSHSHDNLIKGNRFSGNDDESILMEGGARNEITRNHLARNGAGITLGPGSENVITRNRVLGGRDGIRIEGGHGNLVAHNVAVRTRHVGITLGIKHPFSGGARNVVRRNLVRGSHVDGFVVTKKDRHSLLKRNIATAAGDDGFDIESHSAKLTSNRAVRNDDLGIEAVRRVIDGGGNVARHNGDPRQCTNIACS